MEGFFVQRRSQPVRIRHFPILLTVFLTGCLHPVGLLETHSEVILERKAYEDAHTQGTPEAYAKFIHQNPQSHLVKKARKNALRLSNGAALLAQAEENLRREDTEGKAVNAAQLVYKRRDYATLGIGYQQGGALVIAKYEHRLTDWFALGLWGGSGINYNYKLDLNDQNGVKYKHVHKADAVPSIGIMTHWMVPRGFFRGLGIGLGLDAYYHRTTLEITDPNGMLYHGSVSGTGYNVNFLPLTFGFSQKDQGQPGVWTMDFNLGLKIDIKGAEATSLAPDGSSIITTFGPNSGLYFTGSIGYKY